MLFISQLHSNKMHLYGNITGNIHANTLWLNNYVLTFLFKILQFVLCLAHTVPTSDVSKCRSAYPRDFANVNLFLDISVYFIKFTF